MLPSAQPAPLLAHNNHFNAIRLAAASQVLLYHVGHHLEFPKDAYGFLGFFPGVPVFFFISGFLVSASYQRLRSQGRPTSRFFRNRFLRIFPGLWACVAVSVLLLWATGHLAEHPIPWGGFMAWVAGQSSICQFYNPPFLRDFGVGVINGSLWTISVELQFYLLIPLLLALLGASRKAFILLTVLSVIVHCTHQAGFWGSGMIDKLLSVSFMPWLYMFNVGILAANATRVEQRLWSSSPWIVLPCFFLAFIGGERLFGLGLNPVSFLLLAIMILRVGTAPASDRSFLARTIQQTDISYGVYLYHMLVVNAAIAIGFNDRTLAAACIVAVTVVLATLSWCLIERPFLAIKRRRPEAEAESCLHVPTNDRSKNPSL